MTVALGILTLLAALVSLAALVRAHLLPTGYDPVSNAVSDFGVGPYRVKTISRTPAVRSVWASPPMKARGET